LRAPEKNRNRGPADHRRRDSTWEKGGQGFLVLKHPRKTTPRHSREKERGEAKTVGTPAEERVYRQGVVWGPT